MFLKDIWPTQKDISDTIASSINREMFGKNYADVFKGDERWRNLPTPAGNTFEWDPKSTYVRKPPYFDGMPADPEPVTDITGARVLALLGDSVTTDHISPAGNIKAGTPAAQYLDGHGVDKKDYNSYGSRRGNHEVMIRGTFANIRLRNQLLDDVSGGYTRDFTQPDGPQAFIYDAAQNYAAQNIPLVVLGGKEYGSGSSRDWAAKGTSLLGVRAVITESFERIHRSNLIGMGVIPLQFPAGESAASLKLDGTEIFDITGIEELNTGKTPKTVHVKATKGDGSTVEFDAVVRIDTPGEADYYRNGGILQYVLRNMLQVRLAGAVEGHAPGQRGSSGGPPPSDPRRRPAVLRRVRLRQGDRARLEQTIGLSRGAIFHHFRDKDTLFFELAREDAERMAEVGVPRGPDPGDARHARRARPIRLAGHAIGDRAQAAQRPGVPPGLGGAVGRAVGGDHRTGCGGRSRRAGCATTCPATCCSAIWIWCSTAWWPGWPPARIPKRLSAVVSIWSRHRCGSS